MGCVLRYSDPRSLLNNNQTKLRQDVYEQVAGQGTTQSAQHDAGEYFYSVSMDTKLLCSYLYSNMSPHHSDWSVAVEAQGQTS
jgi:hypothetical protein